MRYSDPNYDIHTGQWAKEDWELELEREHRRQYIAEVITLPGRDPAVQDHDQWLPTIVKRVWFNQSDRLATSVPDLKDHPDDCWFWCGAHQSDGRAVTKVFGKVRPVPRVLWAALRGGSPDTTKQVVRTCWDRGTEECVNPFHAQLMTISDATKYRHSRQRKSAFPLVT